MIDALNVRIYATVNNGVYKAGFATTQQAYEEAVRPLFATFDMLEERLARERYLCGDRLTEADWRLFTDSIPFMLRISNATCGGSWITQTCGDSPASFISTPA